MLEIIEQCSRVWSSSKIKVFSELKFQYQEEEEFRMFFLPYVWSLGMHFFEYFVHCSTLVHKHSLIYWDEDRVNLWKSVEPEVPIDPSVPL